MDNSINPYDLGENIVELTQRININDLVRQAQKELKISFLQAQIEALGIEVQLATSKTRFNGERLWFLCPKCNRRAGTLYKHPLQEKVGCRICLQLCYKKQRFNRLMDMRGYSP